MADDSNSDASTSTSSFSLTEHPRASSRNYEWYWENVGKEVLAHAMENKPDGTFAIREASTQDGYTLTLRVGGANKLIRIIVRDGKSGFTGDSCDFDSLHELVQFYSKHSLKAFNEHLNVHLLHPLKNPSTTNNSRERVPKPPARHGSILLPLHVVKCQFEGLQSEYERVSRHFDQQFIQKETISDECQRLKRLAGAYSLSLELFSKSISQLRDALNAEDADSTVLRTNIELQEGRLSEVGKAKQLTEESLEEVTSSLRTVESALEAFRPRLLTLHRKKDECKGKLLEHYKAQKKNPQDVETFLREISFNLDVEPPNLTEFLLKLPLKWNPSRWMARDSDKEKALKIVKSEMRRRTTIGEESDGIFLIRPSQSNEGFFALVVSSGGHVHNCLIEYSTDKADYSGYAFHNTNLYFASLVDFVRYYSFISLKEHNEQLDTRLLLPAVNEL